MSSGKRSDSSANAPFTASAVDSALASGVW